MTEAEARAESDAIRAEMQRLAERNKVADVEELRANIEALIALSARSVALSIRMHEDLLQMAGKVGQTSEVTH